MRLAIIGSRTFNSFSIVEKVLDKYKSKITTVVSGGARGADSIGAAWANKYDKKLVVFKPNWDTYGKSAGYLRNKDIIENCDGCIAFWDGKSKGTKHSFKLCKEFKKPLKVIDANTGKERDV
jgi:hypothetical protein